MASVTRQAAQTPTVVHDGTNPTVDAITPAAVDTYELQQITAQHASNDALPPPLAPSTTPAQKQTCPTCPEIDAPEPQREKRPKHVAEVREMLQDLRESFPVPCNKALWEPLNNARASLTEFWDVYTPQDGEARRWDAFVARSPRGLLQRVKESFPNILKDVDCTSGEQVIDAFWKDYQTLRTAHTLEIVESFIYALSAQDRRKYFPEFEYTSKREGEHLALLREAGVCEEAWLLAPMTQQITDRLFIGPCWARMYDVEPMQIKTVINCTNIDYTEELPLPAGCEEIRLDLSRFLRDDAWGADELEQFGQVSAAIDESLKKGNVLVHCQEGVNRSATAVAAYLLAACCHSVSIVDDHMDAFIETLREMRPAVNPERELLRAWVHHVFDSET